MTEIKPPYTDKKEEFNLIVEIVEIETAYSTH